jgi:hypothetical protein
MPKFSVIIPTYNRARYVRCAIESVLGQSVQDCEIIVVDDGSKDNTRQVVEGFGEKIRFLYQENKGVSSARNHGLRAAKGDWIAFLDSDDEWSSQYLARQADIISHFQGIVGSILNSQEVGLGEPVDNFAERKLLPMFGASTEILIPEPFATVIRNHISILNTCVFRRDTISDGLLFDESLTIGEDLEFIAKMGLKGPFVLSKVIGAVIYRRQEALSNLSAQFFKQGLWTRHCWRSVYDRFLQAESLSRDQRLALQQKFAANQRALGNLYLETRRISEARNAYWDALRAEHSLASAVRLALSYLPLRIGRCLLQNRGRIEPGECLPILPDRIR